ncbi:hypothetical protein GCM10009647_000220 [Streptomyces sanglieri]
MPWTTEVRKKSYEETKQSLGQLMTQWMGILMRRPTPPHEPTDTPHIRQWTGTQAEG